MRIFRYVLKIDDEQIIDMPLGSEILSAAPARHTYAIDVWVKVPEVAPAVPYRFLIRGTGHPLGEILSKDDFIGTCVMDDGLVWHVFQKQAT